MRFRYPDWLVVQKPGSGGSRDPNTGRWIPAPGTAVYDGPANVQDEGAVLSWSDGRPVLTSDAEAFLPPLLGRSAIPNMQPNFTAKIRWGGDGTMSDAQVARAVRMGVKVYLRFV